MNESMEKLLEFLKDCGLIDVQKSFEEAFNNGYQEIWKYLCEKYEEIDVFPVVKCACSNCYISRLKQIFYIIWHKIDNDRCIEYAKSIKNIEVQECLENLIKNNQK